MNKNFSKMTTVFLSIFLLQPVLSSGQVSWQRGEEETKLPIQLFHSTHSVILPTTETLQQGNLEFEVSHRFLPTVSDGSKNLFGFDGPANIKLALSYGITDDLVAAISRSNVNDNLEMIFKYRAIEFENDFFPVVVAVRGAAVWNTDATGRDAGSNMNFQYYGQLVLNSMIDKKLGIGIVPSYLYNSNIYCPCKKYSITLGTNIQYYVSSLFSLLAEWNPTLTGFRNKYDSMSFGFELETGGHFFKIIFTNNSNLNTSQYLGGSDLDITAKNWRIGFNITRLLQL